MYTKNKFETFEKKIKEKFKDEDLTVLNYTGAKNPATIKCNTCGKEYTLKNGSNFLHKSKKRICLTCKPREDTITIGHKIENLIKKCPNLILLNEYTKITDKLELQCKKCGSVFKRMPQVFLKSQLCPHCETKTKFKTAKILEQELQNKLGGEYTLIGDYKGTNTATLFRHNECGFIFKQKPHNILQKQLCPKCKKFNSKGETAIKKLLTQHNIDFETQKRYKEINSLSFDFYLPYFNLLIEYQGEQHFMPIKYFGGQSKFEKQVFNDNLKRQYCNKHNINLLEIKYTDYDKIEGILSHLWLND